MDINNIYSRQECKVVTIIQKPSLAMLLFVPLNHYNPAENLSSYEDSLRT